MSKPLSRYEKLWVVSNLVLASAFMLIAVSRHLTGANLVMALITAFACLFLMTRPFMTRWAQEQADIL